MNMKKNLWTRIDWPISLFLILTPVIGLIAGISYLLTAGVPGKILLFSVVFAAATNLSVTAGYHRLFAHRSYTVHPVIRAIYLLVGASAFQGSALKWSADHREHHRFVDSERDPYSINKGFWYAHMGWLFLKDSTNPDPKAPDLEKDRMLMFQHRHYIAVSIATGFLFPALVGWVLGSFWAGLWFGGFLRIALTQQSTFFVNSLCHTLGKAPYSLEITAKDSFIVALLTHGEGYHNFHHKFPSDFRNAIRWYQWDPTGWLIRALAWTGLASKLRTVPALEIQKARLDVELQTMIARGYAVESVQPLHERLLAAQKNLRQLKSEYRALKKQMRKSAEANLARLKLEIKLRRIEFQATRKTWKAYLHHAHHAGRLPSTSC